MSKGKKLSQKSMCYIRSFTIRACSRSVGRNSCGNESTKEGLGAKITLPARGTGELGSPAAPGSVSPSSGRSSSCPTNPALPGLARGERAEPAWLYRALAQPKQAGPGCLCQELTDGLVHTENWLFPLN